LVRGLTIERLENAEKGTPEHAEMQRRLGWEWNGMRLHELYFGNMSKNTKELDTKSNLYRQIEKIYGSIAKWKDDFIAVAKMRGIGWAILYKDTETDELFNVWVDEHDMGHLAGATPLLVLDVFEHAYVFDYGMKRDEYIGAFMSAVDWEKANARTVN